MDMYNTNVNADMLNGTFDAAQLKNETLIVENDAITLAYRDCRQLGEWCFKTIGKNDLSFRLVVETIKENASNGVDVIVGGKMVGYLTYTASFRGGNCGLLLHTDDGDLVETLLADKKRWCENARNFMAAELCDYICGLISGPDPDVVDLAMDVWGDENPDAAETIDSWTYSERRLNVYVGSFFLQSDVISSVADVRAFMDNIGYEIGSMLDGTSADVKDEDAVEIAGGYAHLADVWGFDFSISDYLRDWADYNIIDLLTSDGIFGFKTLMEPTFEPNWQNGDTLALGKRRYTNDEFRDDVLNFLYDWVHWAIDDALHTDDASDECDAVVNLLYDAWGERFDIDVFHWLEYDAENECVFDPDAFREKTETEKQIADYCRNYGYDWLTEYDVDYNDALNTDDFTLLPMLGEEPDGFFDEFGEDADWDYDAMYEGFADALYELTGKKWRVECDGYRVYGYLIDDAA